MAESVAMETPNTAQLSVTIEFEHNKDMISARDDRCTNQRSESVKVNIHNLATLHHGNRCFLQNSIVTA